MAGLQLDPRAKIFLAITVGLILAVISGVSVGTDDYTPLVFGALLLILLFIWFGMGEMFWLLTIASSFLGGTFPILGGQFNTFQILMALGIVKFVIEQVIFKHKKLVRIRRPDFILLAGFMLVLTFHAVKDRFGMRFLGSSVWGGKNYVNVYVGLAAFFVIQSVPVKPKTWTKLPYFVLAVTTFDLAIAIITTIFPSSIYKIFPFYSAVSSAGVAEILNLKGVGAERVGGFGNFGFALIALVLASVSLRKILSLQNLKRLFVLLVGWSSVLFSSFRSAVVNGGIAMMLAGARDLRWGLLALLPLFAAGLFGLSFVNSDIIRLPPPVQRSVSFVPGQWDTEMRLDAEASNDYRRRVWTVWKNEYFPVHPLIGRGFGFKSEAATRSVYESDPYEDKITVEVGNIHNGLFATIDALGLVGTFFFVAWNLRLLGQTMRVGFKNKFPASKALRFAALYLGTSIISYWGGAQNVGSFLPGELALAGALLAMQKARTRELAEMAEDRVTSPHLRELHPV